MNYIKLMRPSQWIKNVFCLAGIFFGQQYNNFQTLFLAILGLFSFCLASSAVYIFNDICDTKSDKFHQDKKNRPLAAGVIPISRAILFYIVLFIVSCVIANQVSLSAVVIIAAYLLLNLLYSLVVKSIVILDILFISSGFVLRLFMGSLAINITPSKWIILCTIMLTIFLGVGKRKSELLAYDKEKTITRKVLSEYSHTILDIYLSITAACTIMCYCLFIILGSKLENIWITVPFVIFGIMRYVYLLAQRNCGQDLSKELFYDYQILLSCILFVLAYSIVMLYLK